MMTSDLKTSQNTLALRIGLGSAMGTQMFFKNTVKIIDNTFADIPFNNLLVTSVSRVTIADNTFVRPLETMG